MLGFISVGVCEGGCVDVWLKAFGLYLYLLPENLFLRGLHIAYGFGREHS